MEFNYYQRAIERAKALPIDELRDFVAFLENSQQRQREILCNPNLDEAEKMELLEQRMRIVEWRLANG